MSREARVIDVKKQRNLTAAETFHLCIRGVKHRMLRSVLTLAVVVLAVAFFMFLLTDSMLIRAVGGGVQTELEQGRLGSQQMTRLYVKPTTIVLVRRLSRASRVPALAYVLDEAAAVTGWDRARVQALAEGADRERVYTDFFETMPTGKRLALVQKRLGREAFEYILANRDTFREGIAPMIDLRIPGKLPALEAFLDAFPAYKAELEAFSAAWNAKIDEAAALRDRHWAQDKYATEALWVALADAAELETWRSETAAMGFHFPPETLDVMREQFARTDIRNRLLAILNTADLRTAWTQAYRERKRTSSDEKMLRLDEPKAMKLIQERDASYSDETLRDVTATLRAERRLSEMETQLAGSHGGEGAFLGLTGRQIFLLCISFLVCMVGIANAMLMSITERFREIATMKCLGATDRYILLQFMMEAGLQGLSGGVLGVLIGFVIAFLRSVMMYGGFIFTYWPGLSLLVCGAFSVLVGILLAVLASVQPSWSASRMAPMEAMRVE